MRGGDTTDEQLAALAAAGDTRALDVLLERHTNLVHGVCRRVLANAEDALDATQEALLLIARKIHSFDGRSRFSTWCYRVATNAALDEARRSNRRPRPIEELPDLGQRERLLDADVADRLDIDAAMETLTADYRAAVALRDLVGMDYAEIGEVLGIPAGTVRSRIARGRAALADALGNQNPLSERPTPRAT